MAYGFDAEAYKVSTREQWQEVADAWQRWHPTLQTWLGTATDILLDMAGLELGDRVLDIAAGAGQQSIQAARRVGPSGSVLATDISSNLVALAAREAHAAGVTNLEAQEMDAENLDLPDQSFDAVISRLGLMFLPNLHGALSGMRRVLRPDARISAMVFSTPDKNPFFSVPISIIRRRAELPSPAAGQPGPFSLGGPDTLERAYVKAGFRDPVIRLIEAPLRMQSVEECVRFEQESFGALHEMMAKMTPRDREATWLEVEDALRKFEGPDAFIGPCEIVVGAATR